jgi:hypothetical protein
MSQIGNEKKVEAENVEAEEKNTKNEKHGFLAGIANLLKDLFAKVFSGNPSPNEHSSNRSGLGGLMERLIHLPEIPKEFLNELKEPDLRDTKPQFQIVEGAGGKKQFVQLSNEQKAVKYAALKMAAHKLEMHPEQEDQIVAELQQNLEDHDINYPTPQGGRHSLADVLNAAANDMVGKSIGYQPSEDMQLFAAGANWIWHGQNAEEVAACKAGMEHMQAQKQVWAEEFEANHAKKVAAAERAKFGNGKKVSKAEEQSKEQEEKLAAAQKKLQEAKDEFEAAKEAELKAEQKAVLPGHKIPGGKGPVAGYGTSVKNPLVEALSVEAVTGPLTDGEKALACQKKGTAVSMELTPPAPAVKLSKAVTAPVMKLGG